VKNRYRFNSSPTLKLMESAMKRNVLQKIYEVGHQKKIIWAYTFHKNSWKNCKKWKLCSTILFLNIARGSGWHLQEIYLELFHNNHVRRWWRLLPKQYKIGYTVEATFPSSYTSLFYIQLSNTWRWLYTHKKFPGVQYRIAKWSQATSSPRSGNI